MKKCLAVLLLLCFAVSLFACGAKGDVKLESDWSDNLTFGSESVDITDGTADKEGGSQTVGGSQITVGSEPIVGSDPIEDPIPPIDPPVDPPVDPPESPADKKVSFLAAGDNIIHEAVFTDAMNQANILASTGSFSQKYYFVGMYKGVAELIKNADIAFINQETPVAGDDFGIYGYPNFNAPEAIGDALIELGFDVVNLANNHMLDMDNKGTGLYNTIQYWNNKDILQLGGFLNAEDYENIRVMEKNGIKIAFLSYTTFTNVKTINKNSPDVVIPYADKAAMTRQVTAAKQMADVVIVSMHWGNENTSTVSDEQISYAKHLTSLGVDVILGHHSHTIQPVKWIEGQNGHKTLCYYSLGNFLSTQHPIKNLVGIFADFTIVMDSEGNVTIENAKAIPHMTWYSTKRDNLSIKLLSEVTAEDISSHGSQLRTGENGGTFTLNDVKAIAKKPLDDEFYA